MDGDWASGERGAIYQREAGKGVFHPVDHGLPLSPAMSLHSIFVDSAHEVWAVGQRALTGARLGVIVHYGKPIPDVVLHENAEKVASAPVCPKVDLVVAKDKSIARRWDEQALAAIRIDLPRPTVHARNLFHLSAPCGTRGRLRHGRQGPLRHERSTRATSRSLAARRSATPAFGVLSDRYTAAVGGPVTVALLASRECANLGYDPADTHDKGDDPSRSNRIAHRIAAATRDDGSNRRTTTRTRPASSPRTSLWSTRARDRG